MPEGKPPTPVGRQRGRCQRCWSIEHCAWAAGVAARKAGAFALGSTRRVQRRTQGTPTCSGSVRETKRDEVRDLPKVTLRWGSGWSTRARLAPLQGDWQPRRGDTVPDEQENSTYLNAANVEQRLTDLDLKKTQEQVLCTPPSLSTSTYF